MLSTKLCILPPICLVDSIPNPCTYFDACNDWTFQLIHLVQHNGFMRWGRDLACIQTRITTVESSPSTTDILMHLASKSNCALGKKNPAEDKAEKKLNRKRNTTYYDSLNMQHFFFYVCVYKTRYGFQNGWKIFLAFFLDISWSTIFKLNFKRIDSQLQRKLI